LTPKAFTSYGYNIYTHPQTGRLCRRQANGDQKYVLYAQLNLPPNLALLRFNQIDHCLIDGRHFFDVIDVMAWRGANIDSDHMLVVIKLRARICRASHTKPQQLIRFAVDRLKDRDIASWYYDQLESELPKPSSTTKLG
jgi:hypothetical protein